MKLLGGLCLILVSLNVQVGSSQADSRQPSVEQIVTALVPGKKGEALTRSWQPNRGIKIEGGKTVYGPPSINLYINFAFDSDKLLTDSVITLDNLTAALNDPRLDKSYFLIGGHADAKGTDIYNLKLSEKRALAVKRYLVDHGVSSNRLIDKGFGESQLIDSTAPEDGVNRRVEVINLSTGS